MDITSTGTDLTTEVKDIENVSDGNIADLVETGQRELMKSTAILTDGAFTVDSHHENRIPRSTQPWWKTKTFKSQNSYLTDAYKNLDIRGCRHLCYVFFPAWVARLMALDYAGNEPFRIPGIAILMDGLSSFYYFPLAFVLFLLAYLRVLGGLRIWIKIRSKLIGVKRAVFDYVCVMILVAFLLELLVIPWWLLLVSNVGKVTKCFIVVEQIRVIMKIIAFLATKINEALADTSENETSQQKLCPSVYKFLYFYFAPTLIYSDRYPRNNSIRWSFVLENLAETLLIFYAGAVIMGEVVIPSASTYMTKPSTFWSFMVLVIQNMIPSGSILFLLNVGAFHSMQNFFGELLRFADRRFHDAWWNEVSSVGYYRKSNFLVQDWIYYYVYLPLRNWSGNRFITQLCVLCLSAMVHEICVVISLGFCTPLLFATFVASGFSVLIREKQGNGAFRNYLFLLSIPIGCSILIMFYAVEDFAREHCQRIIDSYWDYFVPRIFNCTLMGDAQKTM